MKKHHIIVQRIISIAAFAWAGSCPTPLHTLPQSNAAVLQAETTGATIRTALTTGWRIAKSSADSEAVETITKGVDLFKTLYDSYIDLLKRQPSLEVQVNETLDSLKQTLATTQSQLRASQAKETELAKTQADLLTRTAEYNDARLTIQTLTEENTKLKEQLTLMQHDQELRGESTSPHTGATQQALPVTPAAK